MAIGTGTFGGGRSSNQMRALGADGVADMLAAGYDNGVFFWDSADSYGTHDAIKIALKRVPREKVTILTKTDASTPEKLKDDLDRFRQEAGTDYFDILLLHARNNPKWDEVDKASMDVLSEAKQKKIVRSVGISCHSLEAMSVAAKSPWLDVCLGRFNCAGVRMDGSIDEVQPLLAQLKANGKGIIAMKVLGEGTLVETDRVDEALRFAVTKDVVHCFTIGCESRAQVMDNIARIAKVSQMA